MDVTWAWMPAGKNSVTAFTPPITAPVRAAETHESASKRLARESALEAVRATLTNLNKEDSR